MNNDQNFDNEPNWLRGLNPPQREAVLTTEGPVLMLAGAGTGKTAALTARLANIIYTRKAWPSEILAVTFTNKAAREMRERIGKMIGDAVEGMPWLGTFHSIGAKMLRRHAELVGLESNFTIIDTSDQLRLLKQLIQAENLDEKRWPAKLLASLIDKWKNKGLMPEDINAGESEAYANGKGQLLYQIYQARLKTLNACDFGDLLLLNLKLMRENRDILEQYQERFKYMLVDEYQDTNAVQYLWLRLLAQRRKNICVVGDDDQSIYSWRGAEVTNILRFEKDFPGAKTVKLEQNYRSTRHILGAASGLINANSDRLGKTLWTEIDGGEPVKILGVWDGPEEARRVGEEIEALAHKGHDLNDAAILVRAQFQTREFEDRFIQIGLNYRIIGGARFYERAEIRDAIAYLRIINQPADDLAFERIVNTPKRGIGGKALEKIHIFARALQSPLYTAAAELCQSDEMSGKAKKSLADLCKNIARWRDEAGQISPSELTRMVMDECGYTDMLQADRSAESTGRLENLTELTRAMEDYETLGDFLEHVSLVMDNDNAASDRSVTIMTIHAAKGLEFKNLFLVGWEEGVFPSQRAMDEGGLASLEEERRLAYVAITRARENCTIFHAANRRIYGQWTSSIPSRFIDELPDEHIEMQQSNAGGASLWRANWSENEDPFKHLSAANATRAGARGPGWQRAALASNNASDNKSYSPASSGSGGTLRDSDFYRPLPRVKETGRSAASYAQKGRSDVAIGMRVFHEKFGYGEILEIEGNKLEIEFEHGGSKRVMDSFIKVG
ncbi:DNA helicase II [Sphingorhabdus lutea]|uniref:DNA 3'-5' helicase n=1 Tax=Sphingorhabdus lutea TaxID=1913578 RepID=A0A1L3JD01_9SPHN|nr:UvrD-helicase domain-containing protein [Sphingorhabdus lutea]APG63008.1 DNA helicase II [Sphingorhabdus lutea]